MTRTTNARIAGFTFLFYIAVAFPSMVLFDRAARGEGIAAQLASIAQHATNVRVAVVLSLLGCFSALVLASVLLVVGLPLQIAGVLRGSITQLIYLPMLAFEIPLGLWLLIKGVAIRPNRQSPQQYLGQPEGAAR